LAQSGIRLLFNYWEVKPADLGVRLDDLLQSGVESLTSYVPWQTFESDISHSLMKYLVAATERSISVSLILTPEVGFDCERAGLPKDLFSKSEIFSQLYDQSPSLAVGPPRTFKIPSHFAEEFTKRYTNYISRFNAFFVTLDRNNGNLLQNVKILLGGGFWKYYRPASLSTVDAFSGNCFDYSKNFAIRYREEIDQFYLQDEFQDPDPVSANLWKTRAYEDANRRWFHQCAEESFRKRTETVLLKRGVPLDISQVEIFTPELDPSIRYSEMLRSLGEAPIDFFRLSRLVDEYAHRVSSVDGDRAEPIVHWSFFPGLQKLSDSEKQFLIIKSMLLTQGQGGTVLIDVRDWLDFSLACRRRVMNLSKTLSDSGYRVFGRVKVVTSHLWSSSSLFWPHVKQLMGNEGQLVHSLDGAMDDPATQTIFIDDMRIVRFEDMDRLQKWSRSGKTVVLPNGRYLTESVKRMLKAGVDDRDIIPDKNFNENDSQSGQIYADVFEYGAGRVILLNIPESADLSKTNETVSRFVGSTLRKSKVLPVCRHSHRNVTLIPMGTPDEIAGCDRVLFVLNSSQKSVNADLFFPQQTQVANFEVSDANGSVKNVIEIESNSLFNLDVPSCGILPIKVHLTENVVSENQAAESISQESEKSKLDVQIAELPGLEIDMEFLV